MNRYPQHKPFIVSYLHVPGNTGFGGCQGSVMLGVTCSSVMHNIQCPVRLIILAFAFK